MAEDSWETRFAALFCGYLTAADEVATGIPAALEKRTFNGGMVAASHPRPRLVVRCVLGDKTTRRLLEATVLVDLLTKVGEGGTAPEMALRWMQAVRRRLEDDAAWQGYVLSRPVEERTGFRILKRRLAEPEERDDQQERTLDYRQPVMMRVAVD